MATRGEGVGNEEKKMNNLYSSILVMFWYLKKKKVMEFVGYTFKQKADLFN